MHEYERQFTEAVAENLAASIANEVRDGDVSRLVDSEEALTEKGRLYVRGYLVGRLSMLRAGAVGNPNLSADDTAAVAEILDEHEARIAAELYA